MELFRYIAAILVLLSLVSTASASTYYVAVENANCSDSGPGSQLQPWCSIQKAASTLGSGDTALVRGGVYREAVSINVSGTASEPITFKAYPGETPILDGSQPLTGWSKCNSPAEALGNSNWQHIYKAEVESLQGLNIWESGAFLPISQEPNQSNDFLQNWDEYKPLNKSETPEGTTTFIVDSGLTQPDDFWNGAKVKVWLHDQGNTVVEKTVADFISAEHKLVLSSALPSGINYTNQTAPDAYSLQNHPALIDRPGEYYYENTQNASGKYNVYFWPKSEADLGTLSIPEYATGFYFSGGRNYIVIDGFDIRQFSGTDTRSGGIVCPAGFTHASALIKNNKVHDISGYGGISLQSGDKDVIENNEVRNMKDGASGIQILSSSDVTVRNNIVSSTSDTAIRISAVSKCELSHNTISTVFNHSNGMSFYVNSHDILIAHNTITDTAAACTFNTGNNFTIYGNVFQGREDAILVFYPGTYHGMLILNNVLVSASGTASLKVSNNADEAPIVKNNTLDGYVGSTNYIYDDPAHHTNNIYTKRSYEQKKAEWDYGSGEITADSSSVFVNPTALDFRLKEGSPAIGAGTDVSSLLPTAEFPDYNFQEDLLGNTRPQGSWDIGPYEYQSGQQGQCAGTDTSCGAYSNCTNCDSLDACNGNSYRNYYCSGTSCSYSEDNCSDCSCSCGGYNAAEGTASGNCSDGKDNDCDGSTDAADTGCSAGETQPPSDYRAYWALDEGSGSAVADASANAANGTLVGMPAWQAIGCHGGSCLDFDGTQDYIEISNDSALNISGAVTVSLWIKPTASTSTAWQRVLTAPSGFGAPYGLFYQASTGRLFVSRNASTSLTKYAQLTPGQWQHVAAGYTASNAAFIYVDGAQKSLSNSTEYGGTSTGKFRMGARQTNANFLNGMLDEIRVYNRALSGGEIAAIYGYSGTGAECVDNAALANYLSGWKSDSIAMPTLMQKISLWKSGAGCTP